MRQGKTTFCGISAAIFAAVLSVSVVPVSAATPPDRINYQGVLRDASDAPLDGDYDMVFRMWSAETAGDEILLDRHLAVNLQAVTVSGGLFGAQIGSGEMLDGSGPGTYATLTEVFRNYGDLWLEVQIGTETLSPRVAIAAAGYALNASNLDGRPASAFLDDSAGTQTKTGNLIAGTASGSGNDVGLEGYGLYAGGYFKDSDQSGYAEVGYGDYGISASGSYVGGYFKDSNHSGGAYVGFGDYGISASGSYAGGYFEDSNHSGGAYVGFGDVGIQSFGMVSGGVFQDQDNSGYAFVGHGDYGIQAFGTVSGAYFGDSNSTGWAEVGHGDRGIWASGNYSGGHFKNSIQSGYAEVGYGDYGIWAAGNTSGGYFEDRDGSGYAFVGTGDRGIQGLGHYSGGFFQDSDSSGYAEVGYGDNGIGAYGNAMGGWFKDLDSGTYVRTAYGTSSVSGNGTKNFIQNHPDDPGRTIAYAALEGDEAGTYTRGSGRLQNGVARIALGETFGWVTNPDIGLTAQVTPRGDCNGIMVVSLTSEELIVQELAGGTGNAAFDFVVFGLRIGFEEIPIVTPKDKEAYIPSMVENRELLAGEPELRGYTALERFRAMTAQVHGIDAAQIDLSRTTSMVARIHEFDPATDEVETPVKTAKNPIAPAASEANGPASSEPKLAKDDHVASIARVGKAAAVTRVESEPVAPRSAVWLPVGEAVEAGDLLAFDPDRPGMLMPAASAQDPGIVGIASGDAVVVDGGLEVALVETNYAELKVDAGYGEIRRGDLLTSSFTPGHAMRALETLPGTIIAKALDDLPSGTGTVRVLLLAR